MHTLTFNAGSQGDGYVTGNFSELVLNQLREFYSQEVFCDFEIIVEGKTFKVINFYLVRSIFNLI